VFAMTKRGSNNGVGSRSSQHRTVHLDADDVDNKNNEEEEKGIERNDDSENADLNEQRKRLSREETSADVGAGWRSYGRRVYTRYTNSIVHRILTFIVKSIRW
jgi:hypothetical protein